MEFAIRCFCLGKTKAPLGLALIKRPLGPLLVLGSDADKLIARANMELVIRGSNLDVWPLGCFCLDKTAKPIGPAFAENGLARPLIN